MSAEGGGDPSVVDQLLTSVRRQVGVDAAYLTQYGLAETRVRALAGRGGEVGVAVGATGPLHESACLAAITGRMPPTLADTRSRRASRRLAWDRERPIGAFAAAPVHLPDGTLFGGLCVAHRSPLPEFGPATEQFLAAIADVVGAQLADQEDPLGPSELERAAILHLFDEGQLSTVLQPVVDLASGRTLGVEALSRFATSPPRPPNLWFSAAARHGLGVELEAAAIQGAVSLLDELPRQWFMSVNASPALVQSGLIDDIGVEIPDRQLVVEITEHAAVADYAALSGTLGRLRGRGVRVAVDDAGAGFASLRHVVKLRPDTIKIDGSLIRNIDTEPLHRAMVDSLAAFSRATGATMVAEAVETPAELAVLQDMGIPAAQGYLFASPCPVEDLREEYPVAVPATLRA